MLSSQPKSPDARRSYDKELHDMRLKPDFHLSIQSSWALHLGLGEEFFSKHCSIYTQGTNTMAQGASFVQVLDI